MRRAVKSVLNQSVADFEFIVVNDGSTDRGPDVVRKINDNRIRVFDQENSGVSAARNRGINESRSGLIAFLDADDEWKPDFLETIFHLKKKFPSCSVFATNYVFREVNGKYHLPIIRGLPPHPWAGVIEDYFGVASRSDPPLWTSAVSVKKEALYAVGLFPVGVTSGEDLLTWARLAVSHGIAYSTKQCAIFYEPGSVNDRPGRFKDTSDVVGNELVALFPNTEPSEHGALREYIAFWHKSRAVSFLCLGSNRKAVKELRKTSSFAGRTGKWYIYLFLAILPKNLTKFVMKVIDSINDIRRRV